MLARKNHALFGNSLGNKIKTIRRCRGPRVVHAAAGSARSVVRIPAGTTIPHELELHLALGQGWERGNDYRKSHAGCARLGSPRITCESRIRALTSHITYLSTYL